ncbi:MAG: hypothetical protein WA705_06110 [Candidatus Ozemobacteraceae bacterium]
MSELISRVPPHNLEAEQSPLGSMMLSEDAMQLSKPWKSSKQKTFTKRLIGRSFPLSRI